MLTIGAHVGSIFSSGVIGSKGKVYSFEPVLETFTILKKNIEINKIECYRILQSPVKVEDKFKGILFFSPAEIESYLYKNKADDKIAFCVGISTANEAAKLFNNVVTAKIPTVDSMIKSVNSFFEQNTQKSN